MQGSQRLHISVSQCGACRPGEFGERLTSTKNYSPSTTGFNPVLINTKECTFAQICTAFESYLAIFGQIVLQNCCANAGRWTYSQYCPADQRSAFAQRNVVSIHIWMLSFCFSHCWMLLFLNTFRSILSFLSLLILLRCFLYNEAGKGSGKQRGISGGSPRAV
mgnify:FL=1